MLLNFLTENVQNPPTKIDTRHSPLKLQPASTTSASLHKPNKVLHKFPTQAIDFALALGSPPNKVKNNNNPKKKRVSMIMKRRESNIDRKGSLIDRPSLGGNAKKAGAGLTIETSPSPVRERHREPEEIEEEAGNGFMYTAKITSSDV